MQWDYCFYVFFVCYCSIFYITLKTFKKLDNYVIVIIYNNYGQCS